jgi:cobalamin-dependent methionine synthase I
MSRGARNQGGIIMSLRSFFPTLIGAAALIAVPAASAIAHAGEGDTAARPQAAARAKVSDATVRKAATAFPKIMKINREAKQEMQQTNDPKQRAQILSSARTQQMSTLRQVGISAEDYNHVLLALNSDPGLRAKFKSYLNGGS